MSGFVDSRSYVPASVWERVLLNHRNQIFPSSRNDQYHTSADYPKYDNGDRPSSGNKKKLGNKLMWWSPKQDSLPVEFCQDTSFHGLKFIVKEKSHISERIFWVIAFIIALIGAIFLIYNVWQNYLANPVVVTFEPRQQDIEGLPFPAVTICNINKFRKSKVDSLVKTARESSENEDAGRAARKELSFVMTVCDAQHSFSKEFNYSMKRGVVEDLDTLKINGTVVSEDDQDNMLDFLLEHTMPCNEMIRMCMFGDEAVECNTLFHPLITDYGKCCVFNMLPYSLLVKDPRFPNGSGEGLQDKNWSKNETAEWKRWKYQDGMIIPKGLPQPKKQTRAGLPYGLSVLVDAQQNEYFCPAEDSYGFRFSIHNPLEMPHVAEFANIMELGKEIYVDVIPELMNADDQVKAYDASTRECYFDEEVPLDFFRPYTATNCLDDCTAKVIKDKCNCSYFYMPREDGTPTCNTARHSPHSICIDKARVDLLSNVQSNCQRCEGLCEDIQFNFQTTFATLQDSSMLWKDTVNGSKPDWAENRMSIVHIYYGSDKTVAKLRKQLYSPTDLIASTGGLLGLCLGVSILSLIEVIYFFTVRACFKLCRKQQGREALLTRVVNKWRQQKTTSRDITLNPNTLPIYNFNSPRKMHDFAFPAISAGNGYPFYYGHHSHQQ